MEENQIDNLINIIISDEILTSDRISLGSGWIGLCVTEEELKSIYKIAQENFKVLTIDFKEKPKDVIKGKDYGLHI